MRLHYPGTCKRCGRTIPKGTDAHYNAESKTVEHLNCPEPDRSETPEQLAERLGFIDGDKIDTWTAA